MFAAGARYTGGAGVLQSVQYRDTGVILRVKPIIYADDHDATEITEAFRNQLGEWAKPR